MKEGESITLSNLSDRDLTFTSSPDIDMGSIKINKNEHQLLFFAEEGTYDISCTEFPDEHVMVTVQDSGDDDGD